MCRLEARATKEDDEMTREFGAIIHDKKADLAGPGIGRYEELEQILPADYASLLSRTETQRAIFALKNFIEENLCRELNLMMVTVPLIVTAESGVNDTLDRDRKSV